MDTKTKLQEEMTADAAPSPPPQDKLDRVRAGVRAARDLKLSIEDLKEQLKAKNTELGDLLYRGLPNLFSENGVRDITLQREGNLPAYSARLLDYYHANIVSSWDQERQDRAYDLLEKSGHGDLVKRTISIAFGLKQAKEFKRVWAALRKLKLKNLQVTRSVPWNTLTAMVRETYESGEQLGSEELHTLGATVGQVVNIKEAEEKH
jgi:hypothetical protein